MSEPTVAEEVADFVHAAKIASLPQAVQREGIRSFVNWLGCAIGASGQSAVTTVERALAEFSGPARASMLGTARKYDVLLAALLNGTSGAVFGFDDTHADMVLHPSGPIAAPLLALAEHLTATGAEFLLAFILGVEVECRLCRAIAVPPAETKLGWLLTGVTGGVGAAAATGKLLGLDRNQLVWAMGIAASQAAGLRAFHASMVTPMVPAHAGQCGLRAALLARQGFSAPPHYLEGAHGLFQLFTNLAEPSVVTNDLGGSYEILSNTYKPYPCGAIIQTTIEACLRLRTESQFVPQDIATVTVSVAPAALALSDRRHPTSSLEAKLSLYHLTAVALSNCAVGIGDLEMTRVTEPSIVSLRELIQARGDRGLKARSAKVRVTLRSGTSLEAYVEDSIRSMSNEALEQKFHCLCDPIIGHDRTNRVLAESYDMTNLPDVGVIARQACMSA